MGRFLMILAAAAVLTACNQGGGSGAAQDSPAMPSLTPIANYAIKDIWTYDNSDGVCSGAELFGDGASGCVEFAQVVRFQDGSGYLYAEVGNGYAWTLAEFIGTGEASAYSLTFREANGGASEVRYVFTGDLTGTAPTLSVNLDTNANLGDAAGKLLSLSKVSP